VVDSNVFARRRWMEPLIDAANTGQIVLVWSPCIIAEAARLLTWIWLKKRGADPSSDAAWSECSELAHRWFDVMTAVFRVVDDRPPSEEAWPGGPRDERDVPIWTAAVRVRADFVVTENLRDGPPPDDRGVREHDGIVYISPGDLVRMLREVRPSG
jgi:hypothetical protein